jgi:hypothetical protein
MGLLDQIMGFFSEPEVEADVDHYVLERSEPEPDPRVEEFDEEVSPEEVQEMEEFSKGKTISGEYLLQEVLTTGSAGEVVWEAELEFE